MPSRTAFTVAVLVIVGTSLAAGGWKAYTFGRDSGRADIQQKWDADREAQNVAAADISAQLERNKSAAVKKSTARKAAVVDDNRGSVSDLYRLHSTVKSQSIAPKLGDSCPTATARIEALSDVFQQCTTELVEMARKADGHLNDALTLQQAWPAFE